MKNKLRCPVCGNTNTSKYWAMSGYRLSRCNSCGMVWDFLPLEKLEVQYGKTYFVNENPKGGYANYFDGMAVNRKTFKERLIRIEKRLGKKGNILDIGCAFGDCLEEAVKLGWHSPEGLELSKYAVSIARKRGLAVREGTVKDIRKKNSFDLVTLQDVIEHVRDPLNDLKIVHSILKPNGMIFIVSPDIGGWWSKVLGPLWYHYKPGEHIMYFSKDSMKLALEKAGFKKVEVHITYHVMSLEYILNRLRYYIPSLFEFLLKIVNHTPFRKTSFRIYAGELEAWGQK